jgi:hypothetical protein
MREIPEETLYDQRLIERHITQGLITREQVKARLKDLPDASELGEATDLEQLSSLGRRAEAGGKSDGSGG